MEILYRLSAEFRPVSCRKLRLLTSEKVNRALYQSPLSSAYIDGQLDIHLILLVFFNHHYTANGGCSVNKLMSRVTLDLFPCWSGHNRRLNKSLQVTTVFGVFQVSAFNILYMKEVIFMFCSLHGVAGVINQHLDGHYSWRGFI